MSETFSVLNPPRAEPGEGRQWPLLEDLALALAVSAWSRRKGGPVLVAAADGYSARRLRDDINLLDGPRADLFPDLEILPYDLYSPHPDLVSRRLKVLAGLSRRSSGVIIAPINALMQRLAPTGFLAGRSIDFTVGETLDLGRFSERLSDAGYE
ncbi:MAG: transcription-repair coupling factor, partial [Wenzhouxiangellaceae bacterium]